MNIIHGPAWTPVHKDFVVAVTDNRQKVGKAWWPSTDRQLSRWFYWRSLGETADGFRNADKSEGSRITCSLGDTTRVYHRQSFTRPAPN